MPDEGYLEEFKNLIANMAGTGEKKVSRKENKLERGHVRVELIHSLASGVSMSSLAEKYAVSPSAISQFKARHLDEILEIAKDIENKVADLWVTNKRNRLAEYQQSLEDLEEFIETAGKSYAMTDLQRTKFVALKAVAEELGELKPQVQVNNSPIVNYRIDGVDMENLR
ncbi:MAG TPA: hypothetical protein V6C65_14220 [Allocoleopsis sp.]